MGQVAASQAGTQELARAVAALDSQVELAALEAQSARIEAELRARQLGTNVLPPQKGLFRMGADGSGPPT
jgi:hypothetical protein